MDFVDRDVIYRLSAHRGWPSISLYLPIHRMPREHDEDRIRLKNLLRQACSRLVAEGMREPDAEAFCSPVRGLLEDDTFWRGSAEGLALFVSSDGVEATSLDIAVPEQAVVGDRYYVRPLIVAHRVDESFWALALDKNRSRLFHGDRSGVEEISLGETPVSIDEALKYDEAQPNMTHTSYAAGHVASRGRQHGGSVYAGYGGEKDVAIEQTTRFARLVERGVRQAIGGDDAPLVLFGTDRLLSAYREVNTYPGLVKEQVTGASDYLSDKQIQAGTLDVLRPRFAESLHTALSELTEREGSSLSSHDPAQIVAAAAEGRVKSLFFDESVGPFGVFDRERHAVSEVCAGSPRYLREQQDPSEPAQSTDCGWDLVDLAAAETALHGGEVHAFTGEDAPVQGVAAVFRY